MRIEKGESVPKPEWLERILLALRLLPTQAESRDLLMSYLRAFLGGFQREILWYLGATEGVSKITLSTLKDQRLPPGPVNCR